MRRIDKLAGSALVPLTFPALVDTNSSKCKYRDQSSDQYCPKRNVCSKQATLGYVSPIIPLGNTCFIDGRKKRMFNTFCSAAARDSKGKQVNNDQAQAHQQFSRTVTFAFFSFGCLVPLHLLVRNYTCRGH
jgi:hypothetical protein